jgi:hypothetical protein
MMADRDEALAAHEQEWQTEDKICSFHLPLDKKSGWTPGI